MSIHRELRAAMAIGELHRQLRAALAMVHDNSLADVMWEAAQRHINERTSFEFVREEGE